MHYLDIVDCNAGNHHKAFATNFNPEINIREITQNGRYYEDGKWVTTKPLEFHKDLTYPNIGPRDSYLLYHEELESLVKNFPTIKRARFWMTFGQEYLTHLRVIQNIGMARIDEIDYNGVKIVPLQFLKAVLPNPQDLGENYEGETSIGCRIRGVKDGKERTYYVYNNCSHQEAYKETGMQGVSYTTGVPAMIGAMMFLKGLWKMCIRDRLISVEVEEDNSILAFSAASFRRCIAIGSFVKSAPSSFLNSCTNQSMITWSKSSPPK